MTISGTVSEHVLQGAMNVIMLILIGNNWDNLFLINRCLILSEQSSLNMQTLSKGKDSFWYFTNFCNQTFFSNIHIFYPLLFQDQKFFWSASRPLIYKITTAQYSYNATMQNLPS